MSMKDATLIYPHQLFDVSPAILAGRSIFLVEEPLFLNEFPTHRQKLLLHRLSMRAYYERLIAAGHIVTYCSIAEMVSTETVFYIMQKSGVTTVHITDVTDAWLTRRIITAAEKYGIQIVWSESPLFLLPKAEAVERYISAKKHLAKFYQTLRKDKKILVTESGEPVGGQWSFDADNRQKLPKSFSAPADPVFYENNDIRAAKEWLTAIVGEHYGEAAVWLPYTHTEAEVWFRNFLRERFVQFGTYEDALSTTHTVLFHSVLSPLLNIGLLTPQYVLSETLAYAEQAEVPFNSLEGFVRQILGWREFIRAAYECDGRSMRTKNFWGHTRKLPGAYWTGQTGLLPVDTVIKRALQYGYTHHIERLMVMGNVLLLSEIHPDEVYRWFMAMYVDAYDWVMVPNVYGMSQFADGGIFATKPYISGSNYIKKMSHYPSGDWEGVWTALYWNFIATRTDFFTRNHRLSMMPRLLEKMDTTKRAYYATLAADYFSDSTACSTMVIPPNHNNQAVAKRVDPGPNV